MNAAAPRSSASFTRTQGPLTLAPVNDLAEPADETLMLAYAAGDASAFEQLYARHRGPLYRFLLRHLRDAALADEDFAQTAAALLLTLECLDDELVGHEVFADEQIPEPLFTERRLQVRNRVLV